MALMNVASDPIYVAPDDVLTLQKVIDANVIPAIISDSLWHLVKTLMNVGRIIHFVKVEGA